MIRKNKFGTYTVYCDSCSDFVDTIEDNPADAWREATLEGWVRIFNEDYSSHYCPECWEKRGTN
jgi:hypothetical protein